MNRGNARFTDGQRTGFIKRHLGNTTQLLQRRAAFNPVSYTHLDVYKRQV